jgi:hypothetical protein
LCKDREIYEEQWEVYENVWLGISKKGLKYVDEKLMKEIFASFALRSLLVINGDTNDPKKECTIPRSCEWKSLD